MKTITRKEFIEQVGVGAAALLFASCLGSCKKTSNTTSPSNSVNFTLDVSSGSLATVGGAVVQNNVIVVRTAANTFVAVSAICTHQGGSLRYSGSNTFVCTVHGATFDTSGNVLSGPAPTALQKYNTTLTGTSLRVYS